MSSESVILLSLFLILLSRLLGLKELKLYFGLGWYQKLLEFEFSSIIFAERTSVLIQANLTTRNELNIKLAVELMPQEPKIVP